MPARMEVIVLVVMLIFRLVSLGAVNVSKKIAGYVEGSGDNQTPVSGARGLGRRLDSWRCWNVPETASPPVAANTPSVRTDVSLGRMSSSCWRVDALYMAVTKVSRDQGKI